jgi:hypothetical protein
LENVATLKKSAGSKYGSDGNYDENDGVLDAAD